MSPFNRFPAQARQSFAAHLHDLIVDLNFEHIVERLMAKKLDRRPRNKAQHLPALEAGGVVVLNFADDNAAAGGKEMQRLQIAGAEIARGGWDRIETAICGSASMRPASS